MSGGELKLSGHIAFLRQAVSELREIALREPGIAEALRHIANQIEAEADNLANTAEKGVGLA